MTESVGFEDLAVGDTFTSRTRTVTESEFTLFEGLMGAYHESHVSKTWCEDTGYGERIANGFLTLTCTAGLITAASPFRETIRAFYGMDGVRFPNPVYIGDTLQVTQEVIETESRDCGGVVALRTETHTQDDTLVLTYVHKVLVADSS
ncbi:MaoC/PaaZ C-terminal domain-containing protein [Natrinema caseinilyticum]|uniref:MaoC/PaaZ C-terminal domain-containing protein n=1 Tax=Natrinema caseinilyticum TaxID=2961570 RepID=UPI0020C3F594|nr:MaoC/PaaZ C-terminal domain-containing protein [Natrinema caseinilyticum]